MPWMAKSDVVNTMLKKMITTLFKNYLTGFKAYQLEKVIACYHLPCTLHTPDKVVLLNKHNDCLQEFGDIFSQLQDANTQNIKAITASYTAITEQVILVSIDWAFIDNKNEVFADFCAIYHLIDIDGEYKIINVVSHELSNSLTLEQPLFLA